MSILYKCKEYAKVSLRFILNTMHELHVSKSPGFACIMTLKSRIPVIEMRPIKIYNDMNVIDTIKKLGKTLFNKLSFSAQ